MPTRDMSLQPIQPNDWTVMREQANVLIKTGFLPEAIKTAEQAIAIMMKARELGLPPMYGLSNLVVIKGKPAASAELMLALIYRDHGDDALRFSETTATKCTASYKRRSWPSRETYSFTIQDAATAGLTSSTWKQYPAAMLRARCISAVARMAFPDTIGGLYTPEELGASITVSDLEEPTIHVPQTVIPVNDLNTETGEIVEPTAPASAQRAREIAPLSSAETPTFAPPDQAELENIQSRELAEMGQRPTAAANQSASATNGEPASQAQLRFIYTIARTTKGLSDQQVGQMAMAQFHMPLDKISKKQASEFITALKANAEVTAT